MGEIVQLKPRDSGEPAPRRKLRREPKGFLLVPARALDVVKRIEESVEEMMADDTKHLDWSAFFHLLSIIELSPRYSE
jgi:hypothetical protein